MSVDEIRITVPGNPPRKDAWYSSVRVRSKKTGKTVVRRALCKAAKDFQSRLNFASARIPLIDTGLWDVHLTIYVKTMRHLDDIDVPNRDVDSSISPVLDALKRGAVIDDDIRINKATLERAHDKERPRCEITLTRVQ